MSEPNPEVVTRALVQDVQLPADGGTLALITLDNGHDHTKPNTFGLEGMAGLSAAVATLQQRAEAGEIVAVAVTGKPFDDLRHFLWRLVILPEFVGKAGVGMGADIGFRFGGQFLDIGT